MSVQGAGSGVGPGPAAVSALAGAVVGRIREIELLLAGLDCGAHVVLEGPPGTGKPPLLRASAGRRPLWTVPSLRRCAPGACSTSRK